MNRRHWRAGPHLLGGGPLPVVMGIINVTPDSFFPGARHPDPAAAIEHGLGLRAEGADILDVGGESSRPGSAAVPATEQLARVLPVIRALAGAGVPVSVDTRLSEVARAAFSEGACAVNDIGGLRDPQLVEVCALHGTGAVAMHMDGEPATMQDSPSYTNPVQEVALRLAEAVQTWSRAGLPSDALALDPGIGFGKNQKHNISLLRAVPVYVDAFPTCPLLLGVSRKSWIGRVEGVSARSDRLSGSLAAAVILARKGADILRVHDVAATFEALRVAAVLEDVPG